MLRCASVSLFHRPTMPPTTQTSGRRLSVDHSIAVGAFNNCGQLPSAILAFAGSNPCRPNTCIKTRQSE